MNDNKPNDFSTYGIVTCPSLHNHGPALVLLRYLRSDPLAVTTHVVSPVFEPQTFTAGRELVRAGFAANHTNITGEGDVTYRVITSAPEFLTMRWGPSYMVAVKRQFVIAWLYSTYQAVLSESDECDLLDIDTVIAKLLAG